MVIAVGVGEVHDDIVQSSMRTVIQVAIAM